MAGVLENFMCCHFSCCFYGEQRPMGLIHWTNPVSGLHLIDLLGTPALLLKAKLKEYLSGMDSGSESHRHS